MQFSLFLCFVLLLLCFCLFSMTPTHSPKHCQIFWQTFLLGKITDGPGGRRGRRRRWRRAGGYWGWQLKNVTFNVRFKFVNEAKTICAIQIFLLFFDYTTSVLFLSLLLFLLPLNTVGKQRAKSRAIIKIYTQVRKHKWERDREREGEESRKRKQN